MPEPAGVDQEEPRDLLKYVLHRGWGVSVLTVKRGVVHGVIQPCQAW
jgi:hypothetical protein